ncbi:MAG: hypothetical protein ACK5O9_07910 [Holosporales bacterium]
MPAYLAERAMPRQKGARAVPFLPSGGAILAGVVVFFGENDYFSVGNGGEKSIVLIKY